MRQRPRSDALSERLHTSFCQIQHRALPNDDVRLYFCDAAKGESTITQLEVDLYGNIRNWPDKFMGDAFNEAAQAELARLKRMKAK